MRFMDGRRLLRGVRAAATGARVLLAIVLVAGAARDAAAKKARWSGTRDISPPRIERRLTSPAIASTENRLHLVFKDNHIYYMRSLDGGRTWSLPFQISGRNLSNGAPAIYADEDAIHVAYPAQVTEVEDRYFQLFYVQSRDNGETWTRPVRLTNSRAQVRTPRFLPTSDGLALLYYEVESYSITLKESLDTRFFERWAENPIGAVIRREERALLRSTVKMQKSVDGGRSFGEAVAVSDRGRLIDSFMAYMSEENTLTVSFEEEGKYFTYESRDNGETWAGNYDRNAHLSTWEIADLVYVRGDLHKVWVPVNPGKKAQVWYRDLTTGEDKEAISRPMLITSPPRLAVAADEIHVVWSALTQNISRLAYQRTDHVPPKSQLVRPTTPDVSEYEIDFEWSGTDDISSLLDFSYRFTGYDWSPFSPMRELSHQAPADGEYEFQVRARDEAGNVESEPLTFNFNTYKVPPNTFFLETPPDPVASRTVKAVWSGSDNTETAEQLEYSYSWDDEPWTEFSPSRTEEFSQLREGEHRLLVRARDRQGNVDPDPADTRFYVDLGMEIAFVTEPPNAINSDELYLAWQGTDRTGEEPQFRYAVQRDDKPWTPYQETPAINVGSLAQGEHTIRIRAQDYAGNESNVLEHRVVVDYESPTAHAQLAFIDKNRGDLPVIRIWGEDNLTDEDELRYEYRIVGEEWNPVEGDEIIVPRPVKWYSPGYVVEIMAKDDVENTSQPIQVSLRFFDRLKQKRTNLIFLVGGSLVVFVLLVLLTAYFILQRKRLTLEAEEAEEEAGEEEVEGEDEFSFGSETDTDLDFGESSEDEDDLFK